MNDQWFFEQIRTLMHEVYWRQNEFADINFSAFAIDIFCLSEILGHNREEYLQLQEAVLLHGIDIAIYQHGTEKLSPEKFQRFNKLYGALAAFVNQRRDEMLPAAHTPHMSKKKVNTILKNEFIREFSQYSKTNAPWSQSPDFVKQIGTKRAFIHIDVPPSATDIRIYIGNYIGGSKGWRVVDICDLCGCQMLLDKRLPEDVFVPMLHACFDYLKPLERRISEIIRNMPDDARQ